MRFIDLVLALVVLAALVLIARNDFPAYESRVIAHATTIASPATVQATPAAATPASSPTVTP